MTSPWKSTNIWIVTVLALVLTGMILYYFLRRETVNQQLLIPSIPVYQFYEDNEKFTVATWVSSYRSEFKDTLNYQRALRLQKAYNEMHGAVAKIYEQYAEPPLNDLFERKMTPVAYHSARISISPEHQKALQTGVDEYCEAFKVLCQRPVIRYWTTPYRFFLTSAGDSVVIGVEAVVQNLEAVKQCMPVNGVITLEGKKYDLNDLSPNDLTQITDQWYRANQTLIESYDNMLLEAGYLISRRYEPFNLPK